jgi:hypothetical protein
MDMEFCLAKHAHPACPWIKSSVYVVSRFTDFCPWFGYLTADGLHTANSGRSMTEKARQ